MNETSHMNTNRLSAAMQSALNKQLMQEAWASQVYLSFGAWADKEGYSGISNFLFRHAKEERDHMMKILEYILERGGTVSIEAIPAPPKDPDSVQNCFEKVFEQEVDNTRSIYALVRMSFDEGDWATWRFMQWFVKEQTEEETLALNLLSKIKIAGGEKASSDALYVLDKDMAKKKDEAPQAEDKTTDHP